MESVRRLGREDLGQTVEVLADAFAAYPVMRYLLAGEVPPAVRETLVEYWVTARLLRDEPIFGVDRDSVLAAAALVSYPEREHPPELAALSDRIWAEIGEQVHARYQAFGRAVAGLGVEEPHIHLNMIGVRSSQQGRGLGRVLLDRVHEHSLELPHSRGVSLHTEDPANVPLYEHVGYRVVGKVRVVPELESWMLFRPDHRAA